MAANIDQIFQDFILNKIREFEDQNDDKAYASIVFFSFKISWLVIKTEQTLLFCDRLPFSLQLFIQANASDIFTYINAVILVVKQYL